MLYDQARAELLAAGIKPANPAFAEQVRQRVIRKASKRFLS